ncbi:prepilin peptidase [Photobacterium gaetbulicola]|uniref:Primosomal replication protein N n=1 Tax=Photobacterium gaetbulicola Gung47 TaxID=658445 RepID=A0A0C5WNH3_9GAMM|nr:primosomal replication protein [Photobacterium gaetbulicola]AJR07892.1 primosomal replication protein N`` [Photobacterium gaetbulicola Gung47]PSU03159.1 prepilin peptidase [Photobacterium gaetbulicola]
MLDFQRLEDLATQLADEAANTDSKRGEAQRPLFDEQLFHCRSKLLVPCVEEIREEILALSREHSQGKLNPSRTQHICERIVSQIQAVQRELATQQIRKNEPQRTRSRRKPIYELKQDLAQHQVWAKRLANMQRHKERALSQCRSADEQQVLQNEAATLAERLRRCKIALAKIEKQISMRERKG